MGACRKYHSTAAIAIAEPQRCSAFHSPGSSPESQSAPPFPRKVFVSSRDERPAPEQKQDIGFVQVISGGKRFYRFAGKVAFQDILVPLGQLPVSQGLSSFRLTDRSGRTIFHSCDISSLSILKPPAWPLFGVHMIEDLMWTPGVHCTRDSESFAKFPFPSRKKFRSPALWRTSQLIFCDVNFAKPGFDSG